jgi:hypothetical protein
MRGGERRPEPGKAALHYTTAGYQVRSHPVGHHTTAGEGVWVEEGRGSIDVHMP